MNYLENFVLYRQGDSTDEDEVRQVMISGRLIGIVGLDDVIMKTAQTLQGSKDKKLKIAKNLPVEQDSFDGLIIAVLGAGCTRCTQLESDVRDILSEMKITADLRHITDLKEIARYGVMGAPTLVVNNKVVSVGEVPPKSKIRQWIIDACHQSIEANK